MKETKIRKILLRCKKSTWHVDTNYLLQPPKYLIFVVNRFRYINNNFTKDRCSKPMDMTVVLGLNKFSLQATIDHHGPSMYSDHYIGFINCCEKFILDVSAREHSPYIGLNMLPLYSSCLHSLLRYSTGEFQASKRIVLAAFSAVSCSLMILV